MPTLALRLSSGQRRRMFEMRKRSREIGHDYRPAPRRGPINLNLRKVTPEMVALSREAFAAGDSAWTVSKRFGIGHDTALAIRNGRYDDGGLLPIELEPGEHYVEPQNCPFGHWVKILPCRQCKAIADRDAAKEHERQQRAKRFVERTK